MTLVTRASAERVSEATAALISYAQRVRLAPGDKLPTEREMVRLLNVGRSTVREVIGKWQALGIVEVQHGIGTFLLRALSHDMVHIPVTILVSQRTRLQVLEVRRALEVEASALAATRATSRDLKDIHQKLCAMETVHLRDGHAGQEDLEFHLAIYAASKNPFFGQFLAQINEGLLDLFQISDTDHDFAARTFPYHRKLYEALEDHNPDKARQHTMTILSLVEEDLLALSNT